MTRQSNFTNATEVFDYFHTELSKQVPGAVNTKALENISFTINDTTQKTVNSNLRQTPIIYAEKEWQWYLTGNRDATEISKSAAIWKNMMVPGTTEVNSNYGYFWKYNDQLVRVIDLLRVDPNTRRAIVVHYDLNELERYNSDTPCNVVLNFWIKDGRLHLTVFARSIDLVFGFCNDFYIFAKLMLGISDELGIETGTMHWFITNLHIYERHYDL